MVRRDAADLGRAGSIIQRSMFMKKSSIGAELDLQDHVHVNVSPRKLPILLEVA